jgi:hypothetical protein
MISTSEDLEIQLTVVHLDLDLDWDMNQFHDNPVDGNKDYCSSFKQPFDFPVIILLSIVISKNPFDMNHHSQQSFGNKS